MPTDHLYLRGKIYHCWFYGPSGEVIRKTTGCTDRRAAAGVRQRLEREAQSGGVAPAETVTDALDHFLQNDAKQLAAGSERRHGFRALHLGRLLGRIPLCRLHRDDLTAYVKRRAAGELPDHAPAHPRTIKGELETLRRVLGLAKLRGRLAADPRDLMPALKVPKSGKCRWLTEDEYRGLLTLLPAPWALWLTIAVYTGARREEIGALLWEDVDLRRKSVHVRGDKTTRSDRHVPLARPLYEALRAAQRPSGLIVGRWHRVNRTLERLCRQADPPIPAATAHDLRRTFASWMLQRGVPERAIADLLGHRGTQLVREVYGHLNEQALRAAVATLDDCATGVKRKSGGARPQAPRRDPRAVGTGVGDRGRRAAAAR